MRLAIISDIHGNIIAFETVLRDLRRRNVSQIVCLGDVAEGGPEPRKVLQKLRSLSCPVVAGNADHEVISSGKPKGRTSEPKRKIQDIDRWILNQLSSSDIDFIRSFKQMIEIPLASERTLLCFHGSPRSNAEGIFPTTTERELSRILSGENAFAMACGHTHSQMFRRYLQSIIINPGSVGLPFEFTSVEKFQRREAYNPAWAEFAVLNYSEGGKLDAQMCRVPVDHDELTRSFLESGMPHAKWATKDWKNKF